MRCTKYKSIVVFYLQHERLTQGCRISPAILYTSLEYNNLQNSSLFTFTRKNQRLKNMLKVQTQMKSHLPNSSHTATLTVCNDMTLHVVHTTHTILTVCNEWHDLTCSSHDMFCTYSMQWHDLTRGSHDTYCTYGMQCHDLVCSSRDTYCTEGTDSRNSRWQLLQWAPGRSRLLSVQLTSLVCNRTQTHTHSATTVSSDISK
jgi:hypothetical protein